MSSVTLLGLFAAALSTVSFVPQAVKCWRTRRTRDIAMSTYVFLVIGNVAWLAYGAAKLDVPIIITNTIVGLTGLSIIWLKLRNTSLGLDQENAAPASELAASGAD